jgi:hypothetical protein
MTGALHPVATRDGVEILSRSALDRFAEYTAKFEGAVPHFYLDVKGKVTIGYGCLVDTEQSCFCLTMFDPAGNQANIKAILIDWRQIKLASFLAFEGYKAAAKIATLRMNGDEMVRLMQDRIGHTAHQLFLQFPAWPTFPENLKLACCLLAWAVGSDLQHTFPRFSHAVITGNVPSMIAEGQLRTTRNPGLIPRNKAVNELLTSLLH